MHLHEVLGWYGPMTHRQYVTWQEWIALDMNVPDKHDHYLMQISQRIQQGQVKDASKVTLDQQQLIFERREEVEKRKGIRKATREEREQASFHAKGVWAERVGGIAEVRTRTRAEARKLKPWLDAEKEEVVNHG